MLSRWQSGQNPARQADFRDVPKMIFNFYIGLPLPRGVPGEGPDCHFPSDIVGFGAIPARILEIFNFHFGLKHRPQTL